MLNHYLLYVYRSGQRDGKLPNLARERPTISVVEVRLQGDVSGMNNRRYTAIAEETSSLQHNVDSTESQEQCPSA